MATDKFPYMVGQEVEFFYDRKWKKGKFIGMSMSQKGTAIVQANDGERFWLDENRKDLYHLAMTREEKISKIARHYGYEEQTRQLSEEVGELLQAMNKYWRSDLDHGNYLYNPYDGYMPDDSEAYHNFVKEIADVEIMLAQIKFFLSATDEVERKIDNKLNRQLCRMEREQA